MKKMSLMCLSMGLLISNLSYASNKSPCADEEHFPVISTEELIKVLDKKEAALIVDVNNKKSFDESHIGNAIHYNEHKEDFAKFLPAKKDALIITYCGGDLCTAWHQAAEKACEAGYTNVKHYKAGISGWRTAHKK